MCNIKRILRDGICSKQRIFIADMPYFLGEGLGFVPS